MTEFEFLFRQLRESGCAKKQVAAGTYVNGIFVYAVNRCEYEGSVCPRLNIPSGQGYELCAAHHAEAELAAKLKAMAQESGGIAHTDGIAWIAGHYWACEPCAAALKDIGVLEIRIRESNHLPQVSRSRPNFGLYRKGEVDETKCSSDANHRS